MTLGSLTFLSPIAALAVLGAAAPVCAAVAATQRSRRAATALGLTPGPLRPNLWRTGAAVVICVLLGTAAAQPVLQTTGARSVRRASQILFVVDVSRSMLASDGPGGLSRLARAKEVVRRLHAAAPDVPAGVAGLTDRVLPYVLETSDESTFTNVVDRSVSVESPPPQEVARNATDFGALVSVSNSGFFLPSATQRTCVLVTDGESVSYSSEQLSTALGGDHGCRLVIVRVGSPGDRIYAEDGHPESAYRPDAAAASIVQRLAQETGSTAFDARHVSAAATTLRRIADTGPSRQVAVVQRERRLAPVLATIALSLAVALGATTLVRGRAVPSPSPRAYSAPVHSSSRVA
jgi:hypothetical protein